MKKLTILLAVLLLSVATYADTIEVNASAGGRITSDGTYTSNINYRYVCVGDAQAESGILIFELPELTGGSTISTANLFDYAGRVFSSSAPIVDLYALRVSDSTTITAADWYTGTNDTTDATLLQADFVDITMTGGSGQPPTNPNVNTSDTGDAALAAWLQANAYSSGSTPDATYVIFRYSAETAPGTYTGYSFNNGGSGVPLLTIETAPEPATMGLLAAGGLALLRRRFKK